MMTFYLIGVLIATILVIYENQKSLRVNLTGLTDVVLCLLSWFTVGLWIFAKLSR